MCPCPWQCYPMMNLMSFELLFSYRYCHFPLSTFKIASFSLASRCVITTCLGTGSLGSSCLGFTQLLESAGLRLFHTGAFLALLSLSTSQPRPACPFLRRLMHECRVSCHSPTRPGLGAGCFLCCCGYSFCCSVSQLTDCFLCPLHYAIEPIRSVVAFFSSKNFHLTLLYVFYVSAEIFSIFSCFREPGADWIASMPCQERSDGPEGRARLLSEALTILTGG